MVQPLRQALEGKYEILYRISVGGMGAIYKVTDRRSGAPRVVKVLRSEHAQDRQLRERFRNEARMAMRLDHPNIASVHDFSVDREGTAYIVMEFIDGVTVEELISKSGPPSIGLASEIGCQTLAALAYLHQAGIVHRDIASDNVMLAQDRRRRVRVKLIDLGIAKGEHSGLTATGMFMGKVRYAAPELFAAEGGATRLDERSDLYSFGVLLYELLTGSAPIAGETFSEIVSGHLFHPPLDFSVSDEDGRVPDALRGAVLRALEKQPEDRFGSAEEMAEALSPFRRGSELGAGEVTQAIAITAAVGPDVARMPRVSTTQDRLDREFGLDAPDGPDVPEGPARSARGPVRAATARPADAEAGRAPPPPADESVGIRLRNAHLLLRLDRLEESRRELLLLLESDPRHRQARELLESIEAALARSAADRPASGEAASIGSARRSWIPWLAAVPLAAAVGLGAWYLADRTASRSGSAAQIEDGSDPKEAGAPRGSETADSRGREAPAPGARPGRASTGSQLGAAGGGDTGREQTAAPDATEPASGFAPAAGSATVESLPGEATSGTGSGASETIGATTDEMSQTEPTGETGTPPAAPEPAGSASRSASPEPASAAARESVAPSPAERAPAADGDPVPDAPPRIVRRPLPRYPRLAKEMGAQATVVVEVRVDRDGRVVDSRLTSGDDSGLGFNEAALKAARSVRFEPARLRGEPVPAWTTVEFEFRLDDPG